MGGHDRYAELPPHVRLEDTIQEVEPYAAVEPIRGVRRVSALSPIAEIDAARLHAEIATDPNTNPWRRRLARGVVLAMLASFALTWGYTLATQWRG